MNRRRFLHTTTAATASAAWSSSARGTPLAGHKITSVESARVRQPWPRLVGKNSRLDVHGRGWDAGVLVLRTDQGACGWGMLRGGPKEAKACKERIEGKDVSDLISPATGILDPALAPCDVALHDLAGVILGQPVWKMLGGTEPAANHVYSGMIYFDDLEPPDKPAGLDKVLENCRWDRDHGYRQLKVKIGRGSKWMPAARGLRRDVEVVRAIHAAFPDCELLVDANDGFSAETTIEFLKAIEGIPLFWIEEPFRETLADWRKLAAWTRSNGREKTYLADGEAAPDFKVLEALESEGTLNMRLNDVVDYGFTAWRKLMPDLVKRRVAASPHAWGNALKTIYVAHMAAGLGNTPTIEGVTCGDDDVDYGDNRIVDGRFRPSSKPGFGLGLKDSVVRTPAG